MQVLARDIFGFRTTVGDVIGADVRGSCHRQQGQGHHECNGGRPRWFQSTMNQ